MTDISDIVFGGGLPPWLVGGLALAATAFLVNQFRFLHRSLGLRRASLLTLLRGGVYALLLLFLMGPVRTVEDPTSLRRPLVVLLDASESMGLPSGPGDASRIDSAREALAAAGLTRGLAGKYDLKLYSFDRETAPRDFDGLGDVVPAGRRQPAVRRPRAGGEKRAGRRRGRGRVRRHRQPGRRTRRFPGAPRPGLRGSGGADGRLQGPSHRRPAHSRAGLSRPRRHHRLHDSGVRPGRCPGAALLQPRPQPHLHPPHHHRPGRLPEPRHPQLHAAGAGRPRLHPDAARAGRREHRRQQPQGVPDGGAPRQDPGVDPVGFPFVELPVPALRPEAGPVPGAGVVRLPAHSQRHRGCARERAEPDPLSHRRDLRGRSSRTSTC